MTTGGREGISNQLYAERFSYCDCFKEAGSSLSQKAFFIFSSSKVKMVSGCSNAGNKPGVLSYKQSEEG
jgi:hypothetical protein